MCVEGGREVVVGVRFTLVRLAPVDIPDIPTSRMLGAPPSSSSLSGGCGGPWRAFMSQGFAPTGSLVEQKPHTL